MVEKHRQSFVNIMIFLFFCNTGVKHVMSLEGKNVALNQRASQSSELPRYPGPAENAVHGNQNQDYLVGSCTHTALGEARPWWTVDLGSYYRIRQVEITNRIYDSDNVEELVQMAECTPLCAEDTSTPSGFCHRDVREKKVCASYVNAISRAHIKQNIAWLKQATNDQKTLLRNYLVNLDKSRRIDFTSQRSQDICGGVDTIMRQICKKIKEINPRFSGNLVPMGSAQNQTKIDDLDEFDYVFEHDEAVVTNIVAGILFSGILSKAVQELELPPGWCHGGFNRPNFSGVRENGIAYLLQFDYLESPDKDPLRLSVDFVRMCKLGVERKGVYSLDEFILKITDVQHRWHSLERFGIFISNAEEQWLTKYSSDSMAKTLIRIGKYLAVLLKMNKKCPIANESLNRIERPKEEHKVINPSSFSLGPKYKTFAFDTDEYVSVSDLGEITGDVCLVKSYTIKRIVMYMLMVSESHGHKWTEDDLPDLVICLYMILTDYSDTFLGGSFMEKFKFVEKKIFVPLDNTSELNEDLKCPIKLETEKRGTFNPEYTHNFIRKCLDDIWRKTEDNEDPLYSSRMSAVFQLLRSVCEGQTTAEISMHESLLPRGYFVDKHYVTKEMYNGAV